MISIDWILNKAISTLKTQFPDAISAGFIVNQGREFDASSNTVTKNIVKDDVEIIPEKITIEEIQASGFLASDLKLHIIGDKAYDVTYDKSIEYNGVIYRIKQIVETVVGSKKALWTIICQK